MKNLTLLLVLFIPILLVAQNQVDVKNPAVNDQANEWMQKISSDSDLRVGMMDMMIKKTSGNKEEISKLVNSIMNDPEYHKMIMDLQIGKAEDNTILVEPRVTKQETIKPGQMNKVNPVVK
jgi:hypothetical protein